MDRTSAHRPRTFVTGMAFCLFLSLSLCVSAVPSFAQGPNQAVVIVDYGDGRVESTCVSFAEASISGTDLLSRSGAAVIAGSSTVGASVCKIGDTGCDAGQNCFCRCQGVDCLYWTYFQWQDGGWLYSPVGGGQRQVTDGGADAWFWSDGKTVPGVSPEGVCGGEAAAPTEAPATDTPQPQPTESPAETPAGTALPAPSRTAAPTADAATAMPTAAATTSTLAATSPAAASPTPSLTASATATATAAIATSTGAPTPGDTVTAAGATAAVTPAATAAEAGRASAPSSQCLLANGGWAALAIVLSAVAVAVARRK